MDLAEIRNSMDGFGLSTKQSQWLIAEVERLSVEFNKAAQIIINAAEASAIQEKAGQEFLADNLRLRAERDRYKSAAEDHRNMLEDVVNELDLSDGMIDQHGPLGTAPATLVRLVLERKDREMAMLKAGMVLITT